MSDSNNVNGHLLSKTTAAIEASPTNDVEFCDSPGAYHRFGLRRSMLYELSARGLIKGVSLRKRGAAKGKRLWSCDSIRSYLASQIRARSKEVRNEAE